MSELDDSAPDTLKRAKVAREALIGKSIAGRYVLRALVGHGGMGAVYEAEHVGLGKRVAIKFVDPEFATDERVVSRFAREARAMSAIESAHIVTVFDAGTEDGRPYLVMELLRGEDLGQWLRRSRKVPLAASMHIIAQVLKGLAKAHAAGIVHRDLKPDNVFLVKSDTDPLFAKIVDFGISKIERPRDQTSPLALTGRGTVLGTPFYMCPEQAQAMPDVDARADLYSVGAILFECLTGRPPHTGETYEQIILSICMQDAPNLRAYDPTIPDNVSAFVARALNRDRVQRYASAERMLAALHEIAPEEKKRVPLDTGAQETLMSAGVDAPASAPKVNLAETRLGVGQLDMNATTVDGAPTSQNQHATGPGTPQKAFSPALTTPAGTPGISVPRSPSQPSVPVIAAAAVAAAPPPKSALGISAASSMAIPSSRTARKRSRTAIVATAAIATAMGVGLVLVIVMVLGGTSKKDPTAATTTAAATQASGSGSGSRAPTITSGVTSASQPAANPSTTPVVSATASGVPSTAPQLGNLDRFPNPSSSGGKARPTTSGQTKPVPTKLDINRDLP